MEKNKISLALQGGGSHGALAWGIIDALLEDGRFDIEGISGTSAGGMNALAIAQGMYQGGIEGARQSLKNMWDKIIDIGRTVTMPQLSTLQKLFSHFNLDYGIGALQKKLIKNFSPYEINPLNINPLEIVLREFFDFDILRTAPTKVFLCATNVLTGKLKIFRNQDLCPAAVLASACLPSLFQAVYVNGEPYWDGGYVGNPALFPLIEGCQTQDMIVIQLRRQKIAKAPETFEDIDNRLLEINYNLSLMREMRAIHFITQLIDEDAFAVPMKRMYMHIIRNDALLSQMKIDTATTVEREYIYSLFQSGRYYGKEWINQNAVHVGKRSSAKLDDDYI